MRRIYLIRHAEPDFPGGVWRCIGSGTDYPLSKLGREQAAKLVPGFDGMELGSLWTSPLARARETAALLSDDRWDVHLHRDLREISVGAWEGLTKDEARTRYAGRWAEREHDMSLPPTDGEPYAEAAVRFEAALREILDKTTGDIAVVAHSGVNSAFFCRVTGTPIGQWPTFKQDYASVSVLDFEDGRFTLRACGRDAGALPDENERERLWRESGTPAHVYRHCLAVRDTALELAARLPVGTIDRDLLAAAAELHDLYRLEKSHAACCADRLRGMGYLRLAAVIAPHHGGLYHDRIDEAALLFLADKYRDGEALVSIEDRFEKSRAKLHSPAAEAAHAARYAEAKAVEARYRALSE